MLFWFCGIGIRKATSFVRRESNPATLSKVTSWRVRCIRHCQLDSYSSIDSPISRSFVCNRGGAVTVIIFVMYVYIHTCRFLSFILDSCSQKLHFARTPPLGSCVTQCLRQFAASERLSQYLWRNSSVVVVCPRCCHSSLTFRFDNDVAQ